MMLLSQSNKKIMIVQAKKNKKNKLMKSKNKEII
jgi:hypothetical protein